MVCRQQACGTRGPRPTFQLKARVWMCGLLASQGYKSECAMTMARGQKVPLRPGAIRRQLQKAAIEFYESTGLKLTEQQKALLLPSKQHVRRVLIELEDEGLMERSTDDGRAVGSLEKEEAQGGLNGKMRLHFFARPQYPAPDLDKAGKVQKRLQHLAERNDTETAVWREPLLRPVVKVLKRVAPQANLKRVALNGYQLQQLQVAAQDYRKAERWPWALSKRP